MTVVFHLHGELLMGDRGSMVVELAASWAIVMILTGLYLWWPRNAGRFGGILYPRINQSGRVFWRDLHPYPVCGSRRSFSSSSLRAFLGRVAGASISTKFAS